MNKLVQATILQMTLFFNILYGNAQRGWINIWEKQNKTSLWYPITKVHEAIPEIQNLVLSKHDVYFSVGLRKERKSSSNRGKSSDVIFLPGMWMDIDCSEGVHKKEGYPTFEEAEHFIYSLPLSPSIVVYSGGGYHVYWLLKQGVEIKTSSETKELSELSRDFQKVIIKLGNRHGWFFDNTSDLARLLRIPGTLNYKNPLSPVEVKIFANNDKRYTLDEIRSFISENIQSVSSTGLNDTEVIGVIDSKKNQYPPSNAKQILEKCAFLQHCLDEAATLSEQKWFAMVNVVAMAEDGIEMIHTLSRPYPNYSEQETTAKISRARGDNGIGKPMTCATIQEKCGDALCRNCPYNGRIKSPIVLGMEQKFPLTDLGNAERFCQQHSGIIRYNASSHKWMIWNDATWQDDATEQIIQLAKETVRSIRNECEFTENEHERTKISSFAIKSESEPRIRGFLNLAKAEKGIAVLSDELDTNSWELNLMNGIVDLKTGTLLPHDEAKLMTKIAPVYYSSKATYKTWLKFLYTITGGDQELIDYIQKAVGYSLTGDTSEQVLFMLYGTGRNGKSTFLTTIQELLGSYAQQTPSDTLMYKNKQGANNDIARLNGIRFVSASETDEGKRLDEPLIKQLTGGDKTAARFLFKEYFEFTPQFKLYLATNHLPNVRGSDLGIWRRIRLIPFEVRIPETEIDTKLIEKLRHELPGILLWAIQGCLKWQSEGHLKPPKKVQEAIDNYAREMDTMGTFISERCATGYHCETTIAALYDEYRRWAGDSGEYVLSQREFMKRLRERGFEDKRIGRAGSRGLRGIEVKPLFTH